MRRTPDYPLDPGADDEEAPDTARDDPCGEPDEVDDDDEDED